MSTEQKPYDISGGVFIEINPVNYLYIALAILIPALLILYFKHFLKLNK